MSSDEEQPRLKREKDGSHVLQMGDSYLYVREASQVYRWWTSASTNPPDPMPEVTGRNRCWARTKAEAELVFLLRRR